MTTLTTKIQAVKFTISRAEGHTSECGDTVHTTWEDAEQRIREICKTAPRDGGYDKTDFLIEWADGETYSGRYDATHPQAKNHEGSLADHVRGYLSYLAGTKRPGHMTHAQYIELTRECWDEAREFLGKYELPESEWRLT